MSPTFPTPPLYPRRDEAPKALSCAEELRLQTNGQLQADRQNRWSQYFTGAKLASWMASWFEACAPHIRLLDAGAGIGSLSAAFVSDMCARSKRPLSIEIVAIEIDAALLPALRRTLEACKAECEEAGIILRFEVINADFVHAGVEAVANDLFFVPSALHQGFNCAFLNPPYQKIGAQSKARCALSSVGIETGNLYSAFVWLATRLLQPCGEIVAITPRSFCNGPYFKPFRLAVRDTMQLRRFHVFESRREAFKDGDVLQENIVFHAVRSSVPGAGPVLISNGPHPANGTVQQRLVPQAQVLRPDDASAFIYLNAEEKTDCAHLEPSHSLGELGLSASTGRVVDFRVKESLRAFPDEANAHLFAPLIYPLHLREQGIMWPQKEARKPNALVLSPQTESLLCEPGVYVLVKRFSSKEQKKRIVAAVFDSQTLASPWQCARVGFENHLNYFHCGGPGLDRTLAMGLAAFLNSTFVDRAFRAFNGHTQVNVADLRNLSYPSQAQLRALGATVRESPNPHSMSQEEIDSLVQSLLAL